MGFLKRLFGGGQKEYSDPDGVYFYVQCDNCGTIVKVRANKMNDFNLLDGQRVWHKTIVDNKCFRRIATVVHMDNSFQKMISHEIRGGRYVTEADYEASLQPPTSQPTDEADE